MKKKSHEKEYHIHLAPGEIGRYVILPGDPGRVPHIASFFDKSEKVAQNREYTTYRGTIGGIPIAACSTGIGCPSTAICVEELIKIGCDTFIRVGTAGSLQREVKLGDLCITTAAVREEGTSRQYVPISYPAVADLDVTLALREAAGKLGFTAHCGIGQCKDAFYTEGDMGVPLEEYTRERWKIWERANVVSTSMESAALYVVSSVRRARAGEVLAIIGLTYEDVPIIKKVGVDDAILTAIEAVKILHAWDSAKKGKKR